MFELVIFEPVKCRTALTQHAELEHFLHVITPTVEQRAGTPFVLLHVTYKSSSSAATPEPGVHTHTHTFNML